MCLEEKQKTKETVASCLYCKNYEYKIRAEWEYGCRNKISHSCVCDLKCLGSNPKSSICDFYEPRNTPTCTPESQDREYVPEEENGFNTLFTPTFLQNQIFEIRREIQKKDEATHIFNAKCEAIDIYLDFIYQNGIETYNKYKCNGKRISFKEIHHKVEGCYCGYCFLKSLLNTVDAKLEATYICPLCKTERIKTYINEDFGSISINNKPIIGGY